MKEIKLGTCVPGPRAVEWGPHLLEAGYECLSLNFHMSLEGVKLEELAEKMKPVLEGTGAHISSIGFYCNALQNPEHRKTLEEFIDKAELFGTNLVTTFAGALEGQPVDEAVPVFKEVFGELARRAESKGVRIAIENCPMGGDWRRATCNIGFNPKAWEMMFHEVPSESLGLEWEPAHQLTQLIDPIPQLKQWVGKVLHVHGKDSTVDWDAVKRQGVLGAAPYVYDRMPGFGDTNWRDIFFLLYGNGYEGDVCVEGYHDPVYNGDWEMTAQLHALSYLRWCRGGDFTPNPWQ